MILTILTYAFGLYLCGVLLIATLIAFAVVRVGGLESFVGLSNMMARKESSKATFDKTNTLITMAGITLLWPLVPVLLKKPVKKTVDSDG